MGGWVDGCEYRSGYQGRGTWYEVQLLNQRPPTPNPYPDRDASLRSQVANQGDAEKAHAPQHEIDDHPRHPGGEVTHECPDTDGHAGEVLRE